MIIKSGKRTEDPPQSNLMYTQFQHWVVCFIPHKTEKLVK